MNRAVRIGRATDFSDGKAHIIEIEGNAIILIKNEGRFYAMANTCSHDGGILGDGMVIDGQLECPRHGARFDLKTGAATRMPAVIPIQRYEITIDNDDIYMTLPSGR